MTSAETGEKRRADVLCIGAGPANLSVGALLRENSQRSCEVLERRADVSWHPGLLWTSSRLQGNPLSDLVTPVSPTSDLSFLCFLKERGRLSRHIVSSQWNGVSRAEFSDYLTWAARRLNVRTGQEVVAVSPTGNAFAVTTGTGDVWEARDLVLGVGAEPHLPAFAAGLSPERVWHAASHTHATTPFEGKRVAVVGGGQSAGELVLRLLSTPSERPTHLVWITGQGGIRPMDTSPFSQEYFYSGCVSEFQRLPAEERKSTVGRQLSTVQGISEEVLGHLYGILYEIDYLNGPKVTYEIFEAAPVSELTESGGALTGLLAGGNQARGTTFNCDVAIFATGYVRRWPKFMEGLERFVVDPANLLVGPEAGRDNGQGRRAGRVFVHGAEQEVGGVGDQTLALTAWRSGRIVNALEGRDVLSLGNDHPVVRHFGVPDAAPHDARNEGNFL